MRAPPNANQFLKEMVIYGFGGGISRISSLILLALLTPHLTTAQWGTASLLLLIVSAMPLIFSLGVESGLGPVYFEAVDQEQKSRIIWSCTITLLITTLILWFLGMAFAELLGQLLFRQSIRTGWIQIAITAGALAILALPMTLHLLYERKAAIYSGLSILLAVVTALGSWWLVDVEKWSITGIIAGAALGYGIRLLVLSFISSRGRAITIDRKSIRAVLRTSLPLVPLSAMSLVQLEANKIFLQWYRSGDELGLYSAGVSIGLGMLLFVNAFQSAYFPRFMAYSEKPEAAAPFVGTVVYAYLFSFGLLNVLIVLLARPFVHILLAPAYFEAHKIVGLASTSQYLLGLFFALLPGMYLARETRFLSLLQLFTTAFVVAIYWLGCRKYGYMGAGIALAAGQLMPSIILSCWGKFRAYIKIPVSWVRIAALLLIQFCAIYVSHLPMSESVPKSIAIGCAFFLGTFGLSWAIIPSGTRKLILDRVFS